jgi:hypothetical protein
MKQLFIDASITEESKIALLAWDEAIEVWERTGKGYDRCTVLKDAWCVTVDNSDVVFRNASRLPA